MGC
ncbi:unnamed protein product [Linum tenue]|jgi:hypothetical protein